ncbi:dienelactone hydrolase family protein [Nitrincola nitratireducens]|uniref:Putative esterase n=1 Tax=Nitrincola nitratireducens TaxID=1229521 RepID=W9V0M3_9GAMM|nr:dienelactone hydrolase family protein [Nitrincola nitratireducens]EXJ13033.1 putative esterase [Nitrincola nitratireducens]
MTQAITQTLNNIQFSHQYVKAKNTSNSKTLLLYPTWAGITDFEREIAQRMSHMGWNVWIIDVFGGGTDLSDLEKRSDAMSRLLSNYEELRNTLRNFAKFALEQDAHSDTVSVMGYCLGGLCAIQSTLWVEDVTRGVSLHGLLNFPKTPASVENASLLILNGASDPMVPIEDIERTRAYLNTMNIDWTFVDLGHAMHSFAIPDAQSPERGVAYHASADQKSWNYLVGFLNTEK